MKGVHMAAFILTVVGALNWGLVGLLNFNLVTALVGAYPMVEKLVYIVVGVCGAYVLITHKATCKECMK